MVKKALAAAIAGVEAVPVEVETDVRPGLPGWVMVGHLTQSVREASDRVRTAFHNAGIELPLKKVTINLSPAEILKEGARFDLAIAAAVLAAHETVPDTYLTDTVFAGEIGLNGSVRRVNGILATALMAKEAGFSRIVVPAEACYEASRTPGLQIIGIKDLPELLSYLRKGRIPAPPEEKTGTEAEDPAPDFRDVRGQESVRKAAMIAAAGFHNLFMVGPPGGGKTMIARRIPGILPQPDTEEILEIARIHSIAGTLAENGKVRRPFRAPHHTVTARAMAGGGIVPRPGEITLAHRGVLFLDEMPEFTRESLEILRQPLEDREIVISRAGGNYRFPASFLLVGAANPCPCGNYPDRRLCSCTPAMIRKYMQRISRPLMDRFDLTVEVPKVTYRELTGGAGKAAASSEEMRAAVSGAVEIQNRRFQGEPYRFNAEIPAGALSKYCVMTNDAEAFLRRAFEKMSLTARGYTRIVRVARTVADLAGHEVIEKGDAGEAVFFRSRGEEYV